MIFEEYHSVPLAQFRLPLYSAQGIMPAPGLSFQHGLRNVLPLGTTMDLLIPRNLADDLVKLSITPRLRTYPVSGYPEHSAGTPIDSDLIPASKMGYPYWLR